MTAPSDQTGGLEPIRQVAMEMMRRCGTCRWWERDPNPRICVPGAILIWGNCAWSRTHLPASIRRPLPMDSTAGTDCAMWKDRADGE